MNWKWGQDVHRNLSCVALACDTLHNSSFDLTLVKVSTCSAFLQRCRNAIKPPHPGDGNVGHFFGLAPITSGRLNPPRARLFGAVPILVLAPHFEEVSSTDGL
jgi:hypothetical protein